MQSLIHFLTKAKPRLVETIVAQWGTIKPADRRYLCREILESHEPPLSSGDLDWLPHPIVPLNVNGGTRELHNGPTRQERDDVTLLTRSIAQSQAVLGHIHRDSWCRGGNRSGNRYRTRRRPHLECCLLKRLGRQSRPGDRRYRGPKVAPGQGCQKQDKQRVSERAEVQVDGATHDLAHAFGICRGPVCSRTCFRG